MIKFSTRQVRKKISGFKLRCKNTISVASLKATLIKNKLKAKRYSFSTSERNKKIVRVAYKAKKFHLNHRNIIFLAISLMFTYILLQSEGFYSLVFKLGEFGYFSALLIGFLFSFGFMTAPGAATFYLLGNHLNPFLMAAIGALGAMSSNFIIYYFVKYKALDSIRYTFTNELRLEFSRFEFAVTKKMLRSGFFRDSIPALSGILIALPLPTEMFVSILWNITKLETRNVLLF